MKIICIVGQKGGIAKSTTAEAIIYGLRNKGKKVLGVDLDQSANLTKHFLGDEFELDVFDLLSGKRSCKEVIKEDIVPGGNGLAYLTTFFETHKLDSLRTALKPVENDYDYCIIDTPPTANKVVLSAIVTADYAVIPAEPDLDCIDGCITTLGVIDLAKSQYGAHVENLGILLVKYKEKYKAHAEIVKLLKNQKIKTFKTTIRESQAINNAKLHGESFFSKKYNTAKAVIDYHTFIRELLSVI